MINSREGYIDAHHALHALLRKKVVRYLEWNDINLLLWWKREIADYENRIANRGLVKRTIGRRATWRTDNLTKHKTNHMNTVTLDLTKGSRVDLTKDKPGLTKVVVGLGWDINGGNAGDFDLDSMAFHMKDGKLHGATAGIAFFGNKKIAGVELDKDNRTGAGEGDDEKMFVDLAAIPSEVTEVMIGVNIYQAASKHQNFGMVNNAYMRIFNPDTNEVYVKYDLTEDYSTATAIKIAKLYRKDGEWKVQGIGEGATGTVEDIANSLS